MYSCRFTCISLLCSLAALSLTAPLYAHQFRAAYVQLSEVADGEYRLQTRLPWLPNQQIAPITVALPAFCRESALPSSTSSENYLSDTRHWRCNGMLRGQVLSVHGIDLMTPDVMVELDFADGGQRILTLAGGHSSFVFAPAAQASATVPWRGYLLLGIRHILSGIDHLLFVTGLLLVAARDRRHLAARMLRAITAFTLAHSITLGVSALGVVRLAAAPVEASIAASILLLAVALARSSSAASLSMRRPWLPAFAFGLLHGFGFAGALADIGLPEQAKLPALAMFNVGVEIGQLAFVAALLALIRAVRLLRHVDLHRLQWLATRALGFASGYWVVARTAAVLHG